MGKLIGPPLSEENREWILKQHVFFIATAPLSPYHHVNLSPKSGESVRFLDDSTISFVELSGSGSETFAHVQENPRLTMMFVALESTPKIVRLFGKVHIILKSELLDYPNLSPRVTASSFPKKHLPCIFEKYTDYFPNQPKYDYGFRSIIILEIDRASQSCGYSIPLYQYISERKTLLEFSTNKGEEGMVTYRGYKNSFSIDGLPSIGQVEQNDIPATVQYESGYYYSTYSSTVSSMISKLFVNLNMWFVCHGKQLLLPYHTMHGNVFQRFFSFSFRECLLIVLGILIGIFLASNHS